MVDKVRYSRVGVSSRTLFNYHLFGKRKKKRKGIRLVSKQHSSPRRPELHLPTMYRVAPYSRGGKRTCGYFSMHSSLRVKMITLRAGRSGPNRAP